MVELLETIGVLFLDRLPGGTQLPAELPAELPALDRSFTPPLEYRQQYQFGCDNYGEADVGNATMDWNVHRRLNKATLSGEYPTQAFGSSVVYAAPPGFVHTSYALLGTEAHGDAARSPPAELFKAHNEWFWPRDDPTEYGQLCWPVLLLFCTRITTCRSSIALIELRLALISYQDYHMLLLILAGPMPRCCSSSSAT